MSNLPRVYRFLLTPRWLAWLAAALALSAVMTMLGFWQLSRYEERSEINARIDAADPAHPVQLDEALVAPAPGARLGPPPPADSHWAMVTARGRFDPDHEVQVRIRTVHGRVGSEILTPLVLADGSALLVNRGWVPPAEEGGRVNPDVPPAPGGEVTVVGRVRPSESGARPVERHDGELITRRIHLESLADQLPYPLYRAYLLQQSPSDPGLTPIPVRHENSWLNGGYAAQWWIFAGMVLAGFGWLARREAKQLREPAAAPALVADNGTEH